MFCCRNSVLLNYLVDIFSLKNKNIYCQTSKINAKIIMLLFSYFVDIFSLKNENIHCQTWKFNAENVWWGHYINLTSDALHMFHRSCDPQLILCYVQLKFNVLETFHENCKMSF